MKYGVGDRIKYRSKKFTTNDAHDVMMRGKIIRVFQRSIQEVEYHFQETIYAGYVNQLRDSYEIQWDNENMVKVVPCIAIDNISVHDNEPNNILKDLVSG